MLAPVQAKACAIFGIHPAVVFNATERVEDALMELDEDLQAGFCHGKIQDRPVLRYGILPGHCDPYHPSSDLQPLLSATLLA
jgi:hypothetical protein